MLHRRKKSHGSFPVCKSAYKTWFYIRRPKCDKRVPHKSTTFSVVMPYVKVASVHCLRPSCLFGLKKERKACLVFSFQPVHPSCELTCTLSVRQRSAENTDEKMTKKHKSVAEKRQVSELARERKWTVILVPYAFSARTRSNSMSFHAQVIPDRLGGVHPVSMFSPTVLALERPDPHAHGRYGEASQRAKSLVKCITQEAAQVLAPSSPLRRILCRPGDM